MARACTWLVASFALLAALPARANPWHLTFEGDTDFPVDVGGRITLETPYRIQIATGLGGMPAGYVSVINDTMVATQAYDQPTANLIQTGLQSSLIWHLHIGWRPLERYGFYFHLGYAVGALGGGLSPESAIDAVTGGSASDPNATNSFQIQTLVQIVELEVGWQWRLPLGFVVRAALGAMHVFASNTTISYTGAVGTRRGSTIVSSDLAALEQAGSKAIDGDLTTYVYSPTITVTVGWGPF